MQWPANILFLECIKVSNLNDITWNNTTQQILTNIYVKAYMEYNLALPKLCKLWIQTK